MEKPDRVKTVCLKTAQRVDCLRVSQLDDILWFINGLVPKDNFSHVKKKKKLESCEANFHF